VLDKINGVCFYDKCASTMICMEAYLLHKLHFKPHIEHCFVFQTAWYDVTIRESNFPAPRHIKRD